MAGPTRLSVTLPLLWLSLLAGGPALAQQQPAAKPTPVAQQQPGAQKQPAAAQQPPSSNGQPAAPAPGQSPTPINPLTTEPLLGAPAAKPAPQPRVLISEVVVSGLENHPERERLEMEQDLYERR